MPFFGVNMGMYPKRCYNIGQSAVKPSLQCLKTAEYQVVSKILRVAEFLAREFFYALWIVIC